MSTAILTPLDLDADEEEGYELRLLIEEYDELYERCWTSRLTGVEQHTLDQLYAFLMLKEAEFWEGAYEMMEMLSSHTELTFATLRFSLGLLTPEDIPNN